MARYDKYDPISGGFRAALAVAITETSGAGSSSQIGVPLGVSLNGTGQLIIGTTGGGTGILGVLVVDQAKVIGDVVDVMTAGEIVDLDEAAFDPGKTYYTGSDGVLDATATDARVGFTVGDRSPTTGAIRSRLVVRSVPADLTA